jgi:hypothetical protein
MDAPSKPPARWYRLTPDRFVIALLVLECLLWLSQRFGWFAFNRHKGWIVLIAVGVVIIAMVVLALAFCVSLLSRWRLQFSIRSLLIMVLVVAVPFSWLATAMRNAKIERDAAAAIRKGGGEVEYEFLGHGNLITTQSRFSPIPPGAEWFFATLEIEFFARVSKVTMHVPITDHDIVLLDQLGDAGGLDVASYVETDDDILRLRRHSHLRGLEVQVSNARVTDAGLQPLNSFSNLKVLSINDCAFITDAGIARLKELKYLDSLELSGQFTNKSLIILATMPNLRRLCLSDTRITDDGFARISQLRNLELLSFRKMRISDAELKQIESLKRLKTLSLAETDVTNAGVERLRKVIPDCSIEAGSHLTAA